MISLFLKSEGDPDKERSRDQLAGILAIPLSEFIPTNGIFTFQEFAFK